MAKNNKCKYGLKNVYIAPINDIDLTKKDGTAYVYGTPFACPGAQSLNLNNQYASASIAADDDPDYITLQQNNGYDGELQVVELVEEFEKQIIGIVNGVEDANTKPKAFAILCEFDGDKKKARRCLWHCELTQLPNITHSTKDGNLKVDNDTIKIKVVMRKDNGKLSAKAYEGWTVYDDMFTAVPKPEDFVEPEESAVTENGGA